MLKGTSQAKAMSNSEKINSVALAVTELRLFEGINQSVSYSISYSVSHSVENSINFLFFFLNSVATC